MFQGNRKGEKKKNKGRYLIMTNNKTFGNFFTSYINACKADGYDNYDIEVEYSKPAFSTIAPFKIVHVFFNERIKIGDPAINNLVDNAVWYGGTITEIWTKSIEAKVDNDYLVVHLH